MVGVISSIRTRYIRDHLERENNELFSATPVTRASCRALVLMWIAGVEYTRHVRYLVVLSESGLVRSNWTYHYLSLQEVLYAGGHKLCPPLGI